jgi:hypothetical protein
MKATFTHRILLPLAFVRGDCAWPLGLIQVTDDLGPPRSPEVPTTQTTFIVSLASLHIGYIDALTLLHVQ